MADDTTQTKPLGARIPASPSSLIGLAFALMAALALTACGTDDTNKITSVPNDNPGVEAPNNDKTPGFVPNDTPETPERPEANEENEENTVFVVGESEPMRLNEIVGFTPRETSFGGAEDLTEEHLGSDGDPANDGSVAPFLSNFLVADVGGDDYTLDYDLRWDMSVLHNTVLMIDEVGEIGYMQPRNPGGYIMHTNPQTYDAARGRDKLVVRQRIQFSESAFNAWRTTWQNVAEADRRPILLFDIGSGVPEGHPDHMSVGGHALGLEIKVKGTGVDAAPVVCAFSERVGHVAPTVFNDGPAPERVCVLLPPDNDAGDLDGADNGSVQVAIEAMVKLDHDVDEYQILLRTAPAAGAAGVNDLTRHGTYTYDGTWPGHHALQHLVIGAPTEGAWGGQTDSVRATEIKFYETEVYTSHSDSVLWAPMMHWGPDDPNNPDAPDAWEGGTSYHQTLGVPWPHVHGMTRPITDAMVDTNPTQATLNPSYKYFPREVWMRRCAPAIDPADTGAGGGCTRDPVGNFLQTVPETHDIVIISHTGVEVANNSASECITAMCQLVVGGTPGQIGMHFGVCGDMVFEGACGDPRKVCDPANPWDTPGACSFYRALATTLTDTEIPGGFHWWDDDNSTGVMIKILADLSARAPTKAELLTASGVAAVVMRLTGMDSAVVGMDDPADRGVPANLDTFPGHLGTTGVTWIDAIVAPGAGEALLGYNAATPFTDPLMTNLAERIKALLLGVGNPCGVNGSWCN